MRLYPSVILKSILVSRLNKPSQTTSDEIVKGLFLPRPVGRGELYLISEFLHVDSERGLAMDERKHVHSGNYLTFAIAWGWVGSLGWITLNRQLKNPPKWDTMCGPF